MTDISVRLAAEDDFDAIAGLVHALDQEFFDGTDTPGDLASRLKSDLEHPLSGTRFLLAEADGTASGLACFGLLHPMPGAAGYVFLRFLYVVPERRGRGLGRALLQRLAAIAHERGCLRVEWITPAQNEPARALYDGIGATTAEGRVIYRLQGDVLESLAREGE